jgi:hypothetical protein
MVNMPMGVRYTVYDATGRCVLQGISGQNNTSQLNVSALPNGVYTLRFDNQAMLFAVMR